MKIAILYKFKSEATGGGNQFLSCLKKYLKNNDYYTEDIEKANVILFNSHHFINEVLKIKKIQLILIQY